MINFDENKCLVYFVYKRHFKKYEFLKEDLYQEGFIALFKACKKFDIEKGNTFSTYAIKAIYNSMLYCLVRKEQKHFNNCISLEQLQDDFNFDFEDKTEPDYDIILIKSLNENQLNLIQLKLDGFNQKDIAEKMGISRSCVANKFVKIKNILKDFKEVEYGNDY